MFFTSFLKTHKRKEANNMCHYRFIKIRGKEGSHTGYFVPRLYKLAFHWRELKHFGFQFVIQRLAGWTIWYVNNEEDYVQAVKKLNELTKTRIFVYKVSE